jgi:hypothetical protein
MSPQEQDPQYLIRNKLLEPMEDFEHSGRRIPAARLGYRMTYGFVRRFFGRVFDNPDKVFEDAVLRPETQDMESFADGILYIADAHQKAARHYFEDGSIEDACPPLRVLLTIMAQGTYEGQTERDPEVRAMFTRESILGSAWYEERLRTKQERDAALWERHVEYLNGYPAQRRHSDPALDAMIATRRDYACRQLSRAKSDHYLAELNGTIGAQPVSR